jgi:hypothetical protein
LKNRKTIFILFFLPALLLLITACNKNGSLPVFSDSCPPPSAIRADMLLADGDLQTSATIATTGWSSILTKGIGDETYPSNIDSLIDSAADTGWVAQRLFFNGSEPGHIILTWPTVQDIRKMVLYASVLHSSHLNVLVSYKNGPAQEDWTPVMTTNWSVEEFGMPSSAYDIYPFVIMKAKFSSLIASQIRFSFTPSSSEIRLSEIGIAGPPALKITSPDDGAQLLLGSNINFKSSASVTLASYSWTFDGGNPLGSFPNYPNTWASVLTPGTHTIQLDAFDPATSQPFHDEISICISDIAEIRIKNLDNQDFASYAEVSYRAAQTQFQAIGYREDGSEIGPVSVRWELEGGEVDAHDQLRMGILSHLGQLNTRIGNLDSSRISVASATTVTFNSFLPGNLLIKASRGDITDSVYVRIKQPHFSVNVYPVGDVDTSIFNAWKDIALQIWEKENIIKVDSIDLMPTIANVSYPNYPLTPPLSETEAIHLKNRYFFDLSNPLVYDCMLGDQSGFFNVPRQSRLLMAEGEIAPVNVFMVQESWCYYVADIWTNPPKKVWREPFIYSISSRDNFVTLENSCSIIKTPTPPYLERQKRYLAAGIGRNFGLPQYANWLNNFMDFSDNGAFDVTPLQYITALNYNNDNPQNSIKIWEE